jgi:hypothetical protein
VPRETDNESQRIYVRNALAKVDTPSGFGWDFNTYPVNVYKDGPRHFMTDIDLRAKVASDIWNGPVYFASPSGNNANNGTAITTPVRSLWKARMLLEASVSPGGVILALADPTLGYTWWDRNNDFNDTAGAGGGGDTNAAPSKPVALMSYGGPSYMGPIIIGLTWVFDATSKTYSASRSAVACVIDVTGLSRFGAFKRLTRIAGGADLAATRTAIQTDGRTGIYAVSTANDLVIRLDNDTVVNDTNVKVGLTGLGLKTGTPDFYASGFGFVGGGSNGAFNNGVSATHNVVLEDCDASFGGADLGAGFNSYSDDNMTGLMAMRRCTGFSSGSDIFNAHGATGQLHKLLIDCAGQDAGHDGSSPVSLSNQIVTIHDNVRLISLITQGRWSSGSCVRNIDTSQHWDLGSEYGYDRGDTRFSGGAITPTGVKIDNNAKYWGDSITIRGCQYTFQATSSGQILLRDPIEMGGVRSGTIGAY